MASAPHASAVMGAGPETVSDSEFLDPSVDAGLSSDGDQPGLRDPLDEEAGKGEPEGSGAESDNLPTEHGQESGVEVAQGVTPDEEGDNDLVSTADEANISSDLAQEGQATLALNSNEVEVSSFLGLKALLTVAPLLGVDTIYLSNDIQIILGGIAVNVGWTNFTIVGHPKDEPETRHSIIDFSLATTTQANCIVVAIPNANITVREANIVGRNYYGTFTVMNSSLYSGVTITFDKVSYTGPQPTYNRWGITRYIDTTILVKSNGGATPQEVGEVNRVELGGSTRLEKTEGTESMLWFLPNNSSGRYLKVLPGAQVTVVNSTTGGYNDFLYIDGTPSVPVTIGEGASLSVTTRDGFARGTTYVDSIAIGNGGSLKVVQTGDPSNKATIFVDTSLVVGVDATLDVQRSANSRSAGLIRFFRSGGKLEINDPRRVQLYNPYGVLMTWEQGGGEMTGTVGSVNMWSSPPTGGYSNSMDNMPSSIWNRNGGASMKLSVAASSSAVTGVSLVKPDGGAIDDFPVQAPLSPATFNTYAAYMMVMGSYHLACDDVYVSDLAVTGKAEKNASLKLQYEKGGLQTLAGSADAGGFFSVDIPDSPLTAGSTMLVMSHQSYLKARQAKTVLEDDAGILKFKNVPASLPFMTTSISPQPHLVSRQNADWTLSIEDTRGSGSTWALQTSIDYPLSATAGDETYVLPNALVYVDSAGVSHVLGSELATIEQHVTGANPQTDIQWGANQGILVWVDAAMARKDMNYSTAIEWYLLDAP